MFDKRETAAILAGLRMLQTVAEYKYWRAHTTDRELAIIEDVLDGHMPRPQELDTLCERINRERPHISVVIEELGAVVNEVWAFSDEDEAEAFYRQKWLNAGIDPDDEEAIEAEFNNNDELTYLHYVVPLA